MITQLDNNFLGATELTPSTLSTILENEWLRIWIPEEYQGLDYSLSQGIELLQNLAEQDGSLGWAVTLCSGANYFARNISPSIAREIFSSKDVCFGGSGMISGTAQKINDGYLINGQWKYATGAPHLTHFTLNAQIVEDGIPLIDENENPIFLSFFLNADQVEIIPTWNTMGLIATDSHDFTVNDILVSKENSFKYDHFYGNDILDRIPFQVFADLTLIVNYLGMAKHFAKAGLEIKELSQLTHLIEYLDEKTSEVFSFAKSVETELSESTTLSDHLAEAIHISGETIVKELIQQISTIFPLLGMKASETSEEINQVYRDFFTATQHKNFRSKR